MLNRRHATTPALPCPRTPDELGTEPWTAGEAELIAEQTQTAARMLAHHAAFCPLGDLPPGEQVLVQHQVACYDPETNVVFIATPDLLYSRSGGWVWRETKASSSGVYEGKSLLRNYPQLALAALMINAGVLGGQPRRSLVELEVLTADDVTRLEVSPSHPRVVAEAREVLAEQAAALLTDEVFAEQPGSYCAGCEALPWCSPGQNEVDADQNREGRLP